MCIQNDEGWRLSSWLPSYSRFWFMQIWGLVTSQRGHWWKITIYGISVQILSLQGWNYVGLIYCKNYTLLKWLCHHSNILVTRPLSSQNEKCLILLLQSLTDFHLLILCNVQIRSQITVLEGGKFWFYPLDGGGLEPVEMSQCTYHLNFVTSTTTVQSFSSKQKKASEISIILFPSCDVTSPLIWTRQPRVLSQ